MTLLPLNVSNSHWQLIIVLHALNNKKKTKLLFLDSLIRLCNPLHKHHASHRTGELTDEPEIDFLNRFMKSFLIHINPNKHCDENIPELEIIDSV